MQASTRSVVLSLAPLLGAVFAFPQMPDLRAQEFRKQPAAGVPMALGTDVGPFPLDVGFRFDARAGSTAAAVDGAGPATGLPNQTLPWPPCAGVMVLCVEQTPSGRSVSLPKRWPRSDAPPEESRTTPGNRPGEDSKIEPAVASSPVSKPADFNRSIYYRNKLEFSLDGGWLPINIPFPLDIFVGDAYNTYPLQYTLVPIFASLRWQIDGIEGPWVLRGNWDLTFTGSVTAIPRGPESRYFSYIMGIRRNFVPRNWRAAPYFDVRLGVGNIDAKGPQGVKYAQGQDLTFTVNMGSGVRYNFSPRYAISAGLNFMHISNLDLSQHRPTRQNPTWGVQNYGINVYGPMVGIDIQLGKHPRHSDAR